MPVIFREVRSLVLWYSHIFVSGRTLPYTCHTCKWVVGESSEDAAHTFAQDIPDFSTDFRYFFTKSSEKVVYTVEAIPNRETRGRAHVAYTHRTRGDISRAFCGDTIFLV